jgi:general secretion pathway protein C
VERNFYVLNRHAEDERSTICRMHEGRIVPYFENGVPSGFRFVSIRRGSFFRRIGIENGDIMRRINGKVVDTPDKLLEVWSEAWRKPWFDIDIDRRGHSVVNMVLLD